jgi:hypothetical protein
VAGRTGGNVMFKMWLKVTFFSLLSVTNLFFVFVEYGRGNLLHMIVCAFFFLFFMVFASEAYVRPEDREQ